MNFEEHAAKPLLGKHGILTPQGWLAITPEDAEAAARARGACVVKAQVPTGKRGKAGGIKLAATPAEAAAHTKSIIGMSIDGWPVEKVLVEQQLPFVRELYAAILNDSASKGPMLLFSGLGGMDVEEAAAKAPTAMRRVAIAIEKGLGAEQAREAVAGLGLDTVADKLVET